MVVENASLRHGDAAVARQARAEGEISVLVIQEKPFVEATKPLKQIAGNREARPADRGDFFQPVVCGGGLAPTAAGRDTADVYVVTKRIDQMRSTRQQQLRRRKTRARYGLQDGEQSVEPAIANFSIRVEEHQYPPARNSCPAIATSAETIVCG